MFQYSEFLKIQTFSQNADQIQTNIKGLTEKVCITDQNYFYRPLCHHSLSMIVHLPFMERGPWLYDAIFLQALCMSTDSFGFNCCVSVVQHNDKYLKAFMISQNLL